MKFKLKDLRIDKREWISFLLTLIATLVGVLIAIWLTNSRIHNKEKEDSIKLLQTAKLILVKNLNYTNALNKTIVKFERDTINNGIEELKLLKSANPIPYPILFETIISNELISKNISVYSHSSLYNKLITLRRLAKYESVDYYQKYLELMILILSLEIENQKGEINSNELESKYEVEEKKINDKYTNESILEIE